MASSTSPAQQQEPAKPLPTFAVEAEGSPCRLVIRGVLLPGRATLHHAPFGECRCLESDDGAIRYWMNWMERACVTEGLITPEQAHALFLAYSAPTFRAWWQPPLTDEEEEREVLREAGAAARVLGFDMFRAVQGRLKEGQWGLKITKVEVVAPISEERLIEMFGEIMTFDDYDEEESYDEEEGSDDDLVDDDFI
ncbi:hypothetical protein PG985_008138 [Apiospora marii]|uniref:uncharacterized protein n=1 Tax=Apiospora marii TaxID=335849 RepID=UPI00312F7B8E